jgi:hypothetical protein
LRRWFGSGRRARFPARPDPQRNKLRSGIGCDRLSTPSGPRFAVPLYARCRCCLCSRLVEINNCPFPSRAILTLGGRAAAFLPFDAKTSIRVLCTVPPHGNPAVIGGERTMLGSVGHQLMQYHGHRLAGVRAQHQIRTMEIGIVLGHVGREFALHELSHRYAMPLSAAYEVVRSCHRLNAAGELSGEVRS